MTPEERLAKLGITLPPPPAPVANFRIARRAGPLLYLSGQGPLETDGHLHVGRVGREVTPEQAYEHARLTGLNLLAVTLATLGDLGRVRSVVKLLAFVNAEPDFTEHPKVINGCSDLFVQVFGEDIGRGARSAIGAGSLPGRQTVEIEAILEVEVSRRTETIMDNLFQFEALDPYWGLLFQGLLYTLGYAAASITLGVIIGVGGALALTHGGTALRRATRIYIEAFRNTPALVQIFLIYFGLPNLGIRLDAAVAGVLALSLYCGAYFVEIFRSGLVSVPQGLSEAGAALGLTRRQVLQHVILVPALRNVFPAMSSQMVLALIGTSLISQIGVEDIFHAGSFIDSRTFRSFEIYLVICALYFVAVLALRLLLGVLRRRLYGKEA